MSDTKITNLKTAHNNRQLTIMVCSIIFFMKIKRSFTEKQKLPNYNVIREFLSISSKWYHQESNRGHKDFQSFALPTELWYQTIYQEQFVVLNGCKYRADNRHMQGLYTKTSLPYCILNNRHQQYTL